ncbi:MAG: hypothetical protein U0R65_02190 [Candidatus Nanopelagicales bacterium]
MFSSIQPRRLGGVRPSVTCADDEDDVASAADAKKILDEVKALNSDGLTVGAQGDVLEFAGVEPPSGEPSASARPSSSC